MGEKIVMWLVGNLVQVGDKHQLANRPDGDYKACVDGELYTSEITTALRERAALRGNDECIGLQLLLCDNDDVNFKQHLLSEVLHSLKMTQKLL